MEPINYRRAIRRRWLLIVAVRDRCRGCRRPRARPRFDLEDHVAGSGGCGRTPDEQGQHQRPERVSLPDQILRRGGAALPGSRQDARKSYGGASGLRKDVTLKSKKGLPGGSIEVLAKQDTKDKAVKLANTFVKQLAIYADQQLASQYNKAIQNANAQVSSLGAQITSTNAQIAALTKTSKKTGSKPGSKSKTTSSTTTSTTTKSRSTTTTAPTTTTTAPTTTRPRLRHDHDHEGSPASTTSRPPDDPHDGPDHGSHHRRPPDDRRNRRSRGTDLEHFEEHCDHFEGH